MCPKQENSLNEVSDDRYCLSTQKGRRFWLSDFKNWEPVKDARTICLCAISAYFYTLEKGDLTFFAYEYQTLPRSGGEIETKVRYLASIGEEGAFVDVSADGIERYLAKNVIED